MSPHDWKSVVLVAIGALLAASAGFTHCDEKVMFISVVIIAGALGLSVPNMPYRDTGSRTRATDVQEKRDSDK